MVTIRLARGGAKKRPFYHLTVADSRYGLVFLIQLLVVEKLNSRQIKKELITG